MGKRNSQTEPNQTDAPAAQQTPAEESRPEPTPAAGGRYRRLPDGSLDPITDEE